jgi:hypothetical protein
LGRGEPVKVLASGPGGIPRQFTFRGRRYQVRSTAARSEYGSERSSSEQAVDWMEVRTTSGLRALLRRSVDSNRWHMESILH